MTVWTRSPGPIERVCEEHRRACAGDRWQREPCVCAIVRMGYDLARSEQWARPAVWLADARPLPWYRRGIRYRLTLRRLRRAYLEAVNDGG